MPGIVNGRTECYWTRHTRKRTIFACHRLAQTHKKPLPHGLCACACVFFMPILFWFILPPFVRFGIVVVPSWCDRMLVKKKKTGKSVRPVCVCACQSYVKMVEKCSCTHFEPFILHFCCCCCSFVFQNSNPVCSHFCRSRALVLFPLVALFRRCLGHIIAIPIKNVCSPVVVLVPSH